MEELGSFAMLSIAGQPEATGSTGSLPSSPEISIVFTPETSDDEGEDLLDLSADVLDINNEVSEELPDQAVETPEPYYGSHLARIREVDKTTFDNLDHGSVRGSLRAIRRIRCELKSFLEDNSLPYLSVSPINGDLDNCLACMEGAPDTPYAGGVFWLHIEFPDDYPMRPPSISFLTPVYHPNIDSYGRICIDILETSWSPCIQTGTLLLSILSLLHSPEADDPLVPAIATKYLYDYDDFCKVARLYTESADGLRPDTSNLIKLPY